MKEPLRKILKGIFEWINIIVIAAVIVIPIRLFIFQPFIVKGASMHPTLAQNDYLIVDQVTYRLRAPHREDIVVFRYPENPTQFYVKRIIGLPGERVVMKNGKVTIYNSAFPEGFLLTFDDIEGFKNPTTDKVDTTLKGDEYFVMGDNRSQSYDSRYWGPLNEKYLIGRVVLRVWPLNEAHAYFQ